MAKKPLKYPKMVRVEWKDSAHPPAGWKSRGDSIAPVTVVSVGMMHVEKKRYIVLAQSYTKEQVSDLTAIPKSCIVKLETLHA